MARTGIRRSSHHPEFDVSCASAPRVRHHHFARVPALCRSRWRFSRITSLSRTARQGCMWATFPAKGYCRAVCSAGHRHATWHLNGNPAIRCCSAVMVSPKRVLFTIKNSELKLSRNYAGVMPATCLSTCCWCTHSRQLKTAVVIDRNTTILP
jgi:hypothetical protein